MSVGEHHAGAWMRIVSPSALAGVAALAIAAAPTFFAGCAPRQAEPVPGGDPAPSTNVKPDANSDRRQPLGGSIPFAKEKWQAAGLEIAQVEKKTLADSVWVTGKIALNEDRLAHVYPLVEGVVREVRVRYGQQVMAGDALAVLDSKEVGLAKLELVKNRLAVQFAKINQEWQSTIERNTQSLIQALKENTPVLDIEEQFRNQPMGDYRQQLVSSYSTVNQTRVDYERVKGLYEQNVATQKDYLKAKTAFESATATYQSHLEGIKFASRQQLVAAEQRTQEAVTAQSVSESLLLILGYKEQEIQKMDPIEEGEAVAHYPITAPLAGTVIKKDAVLLEHVTPQMQLFQVADLSTVWLQADIFEKDLPLLYGLRDKTLQFRAGSYPDRQFTAKVTYTGDLVEEKTRAVRLTATADNPEGLLKPGMFVEARLPKPNLAPALALPESALQRHEGRTFVFVYLEGDRFEPRDVETGATVDGQVEIESGLQPGERVAIRGGFALKSEMLRELMSEE
ncbi:MAG TPA: efflux RND transporter periplasmic adaptor subunit [Pirellulales bacterium]|nr:efflux RND transporter periplasmic adaptor subunit [Pirellulales bacterium]